MYGPDIVIQFYASFLVRHYILPKEKKLIILHCVFDFLSVVFVFGYLWAHCEAILLFLWLQSGAPNNGGKMHTAGELQHVRTAVTYDMTSLKLFSFPNVEKSCFLSV